MTSFLFDDSGDRHVADPDEIMRAVAAMGAPLGVALAVDRLIKLDELINVFHGLQFFDEIRVDDIRDPSVIKMLRAAGFETVISGGRLSGEHLAWKPDRSR